MEKSLEVKPEALVTAPSPTPEPMILMPAKPEKSMKSMKPKNSKKPKTEKSSKPETAKPERQVVAFILKPVDQQTPYERRSYRRNFHENEQADHIYQGTNYGVKTAMPKLLTFMRRQANGKAKKTEFLTNDLIVGIKSFGSAYGDVIRNSMSKLAKQGLVKIHKITEEKTRAKYRFELLPQVSAQPVEASEK